MADQPLPIVPYLKVPESGDPYLEGYRCDGCQAVTLEHRFCCAACGARESLTESTSTGTPKVVR
jgi:hypothetical protein